MGKHLVQAIVAFITLTPAAAFAQGAILQYGTVTRGNPVAWAGNGMVYDPGPTTIDITQQPAAINPLLTDTLLANQIAQTPSVRKMTVEQVLSKLTATGGCTGSVGTIGGVLTLNCPFLPLSGGVVTGPITGASGLLPLDGGTLAGPLLLAAAPTVTLQAATKGYVDAGVATALPLSGGTLTGALILSGDPSVPLQAATKAYVDSGVGTGLPLAGGTMTGPILGASGLLPLAGGAMTGPITGASGLLPLAGGTLTGGLLVLNGSGNSLTTNFGLSIGAGVAGGSDVNILTPNGSNIALTPQGSGIVKIGGGSGTGTMKVGTINGGNVTVPLAGTGLTPTFVQSVLLAGSVSGSGIYPWTHWAVSSDTASVSQAIADLTIDHNYGGTGYSGGRIGMLVNFLPTGTVTSGGIIEGIQSSVTLPAMGGTNLSSGALGSGTPMNPFLVFAPGATNLGGGSAIEADMAAKAGSSYQTYSGVFVVHETAHVVPASDSDIGFLESDQDGATVSGTALAQVGWRASQWPLKSTGSIVRAELGNSGANPSTVAYGDDYLLATIGTAAFRTKGFKVDGSGNVQIGTGQLNANSAGLVVDAPGKIGSFVSIATAGSSWPTDTNQYYATDAYDGVYTLTLSGGAVTSVSVYRAPVATGSPPTTIALTPDSRAALSGATGLTINVTWAARNALQLNPSGDTISGTGAALGTTATSGFFHLPFTNGTPTGTPANTSVPCEWNDTSKTLNCYSPGASGWYHFTFTAGAA